MIVDVDGFIYTIPEGYSPLKSGGEYVYNGKDLCVKSNSERKILCLNSASVPYEVAPGTYNALVSVGVIDE